MAVKNCMFIDGYDNEYSFISPETANCEFPQLGLQTSYPELNRFDISFQLFLFANADIESRRSSFQMRCDIEVCDKSDPDREQWRKQNEKMLLTIFNIFFTVHCL